MASEILRACRTAYEGVWACARRDLRFCGVWGLGGAEGFRGLGLIGCRAVGFRGLGLRVR